MLIDREYKTCVRQEWPNPGLEERSTHGWLLIAKAKAKELGEFPSFKRCLHRLHQFEQNGDGITVKLCPDFAPLSFSFFCKSEHGLGMCGGMIFHGNHDGFGSGEYPTLSVCMTATSGWSIHT